MFIFSSAVSVSPAKAAGSCICDKVQREKRPARLSDGLGLPHNKVDIESAS